MNTVQLSPDTQAKTHLLTFLGHKRETPTVATFRFKPANGTFNYQSGQYISIFLDMVEDPRGPIRSFTMSSSPTEGYLTITTRLRGSPFKEHLVSAKPGEEVQARGPFGTFTLDPSRPAVMLAGGIGITPFRSMIRYAADKRIDQPIVLLYSNSRAEEIVFRQELEDAMRTLKSLKVVVTVTKSEESKEPWQGLTGRIDTTLVLEETKGLSDPIYYTCGPPAMVEDMTRMVREEVGVSENDIRTEKFDGY